MKERKPSDSRKPVEPWLIVYSSIMLIGMIVVGLIDEHLVHWWLFSVLLASPLLVLVIRRKDSE